MKIQNLVDSAKALANQAAQASDILLEKMEQRTSEHRQEALKFLNDNKKVIVVASTAAAGTALAAIAFPAVMSKALIVAGTGTALALGFWAGKKITNKIDEVVLLANKKAMTKLVSQMAPEVTKMIEQLEKMGQVPAVPQ